MFYSQAQSENDTIISETKNLYVLFSGAFPAQQIADIKNDTYCPGLSAGWMFSPFFRFRPSPIQIGIDVSTLDYNSEPSGTVGTIPVKTGYNSVAGNLVFRYKSMRHEAGITPFADLLIGVLYLNSKTTVNTSGSTSSSSTLFEYDDSGIDCGAAVGVQWSKRSTSRFGITLRLIYLAGKNMKYVIPDSITIDNNGRLNYSTGHVNSSYFAIQLGVNFSGLTRFYHRYGSGVKLAQR